MEVTPLGTMRSLGARLAAKAIVAMAIAMVILAPTGHPALAKAAADRVTATTSTADHGRFEALEGKFSSGPEVTRACLGCQSV